MKKIPLLLSTLILFSHFAYAKDFMFVGIYQEKEGKKWSCNDYSIIQKEFDTKQEAVAFKDEYFKNDGFYNKNAELFTPSLTGLIYKYKRNLSANKCEMTALATVEGSSVEDAKKVLASRVKTYQKYFLSEPEIIFTWTGGGSATVLERNYDGLEVTYTHYKASSGKSTLIAKLRNTLKDKSAYIVFTINGQTNKEATTLPPLGSASLNLGNNIENFDVAVGFIEPQVETKSLSNTIIDSIKDYVREQVTIKDGEIKVDGTGIGVRG